MKIKDIVNRDLVNLTNCADEPIHIPGSIQPHGFLMGVEKEKLEIQFCSGNAFDYTGLTHQQLLGKTISTVFGEKCAQELRTVFTLAPGVMHSFKIQFNEITLDLAAHCNDQGQLIIESELSQWDERQQNDLFALSRQFLAYMEETHTLVQLCGMVAKGIREVTGYDRVMIYRFDKDYNGEVIAEEKRDDLESFLGLHYPHTDIPAQARELYIKNLLRIIADINYTPVPLYTMDDGFEKNLDLSYSVLRSVSPIHVQYLHNMGVGATLTISLIHKKKLWGLVACHHYSVKYLSPEVRMAARLQGHFITSQIDVRQLNEDYEISKKANLAAEMLISKKFALKRESLHEIVKEPNLLELCNAAGVSVYVGYKVYKHGITPSDSEVKRIAEAIYFKQSKSEFHTDHLLKDLPEFPETGKQLPGISYFSLDASKPDCIIWYRPETISEVNWAGDPAKSIEKDKNGLSPRKSFELWKETVKYQSKPWLSSELATSSNFTNVLQKHLALIFLGEEEEKQRQMAKELSETNAELENINWISTHDLQEPLRKIQVMASYLLENDGEKSREDFLDKVGRMNQSAERMQTLLQDVLKYTRVKNTSEAFSSVNLEELCHDIVRELHDTLQEKKAKMQVGRLPEVQGISFLLKQLFSNLIHNSLKFADEKREPLIRINSGEWKDPVSGIKYHLVAYADNGIGFDAKHNESVFKIFSRLHAKEKYEGSGVGLALCKKIMATHHGFINANGKEGEGVTFYLYFPADK